MTNTTQSENYRGVFDHRLGFGARPAILVVDFMVAYTTPGAPLYAEAVVAAIGSSLPLIAAARARKVPLCYTKVLYHPSGVDGGMFLRKAPVLRDLVPGNPMTEIHPDIAPEAKDIVIVKQYPSAFFGTSLAVTLATMEVDTLILVGCSTSGCIRATAVDGVQHGFRVIVPQECVGDRHEAPHQASLFDINAKYGDVVSSIEALDYFNKLKF